ncbi:vacuolar protein sorting-associated protein 37A-like isoform X3 [Stylophora pistillata]|uniref:vacuolar protein sorting-associated protein 37A-like isoform X3 n=1 Tax=Stylophora pistillata TaxID=50429 RepID=UPI000C055179|nr:vacuolar protein sorting-associated protein 37A-like isoform X3 [Stylophora pistillata]
MSWLFGSSKPPKSQLPPTTALQQQRLKQIESLRTLHSITEVQRDVEYRVTFSVGTSTVFLNITLPPQFPNERPVVKVSPPLRHPWVNDQMIVVGCPGINSFYMHSNLGRVITEVLKEFSDHPPQFLGPLTSQPQFPASSSGYQPSSQYTFPSFPGFQYAPQSTAPSSTPSMSSLNSPVTQTTPSRPPVPPRPTQPNRVTNSIPELDGLSLEELKDLADKPEVMDTFLIKLESIKKLEADKEEVMKKNEEIARFNLSLQSKLEGTKHELLKKCERVSELKGEFANNSQKQKELSEVFSLVQIRTRMEIAAAQAEEESDVIADEFLSKNMTPEEFMQKFLEKRKLCHSRRAKEEKIRHMHTRY